MIEVKQTSIKLPKEMLIKIKALAVEQETTQNKIITDFIAKGLNATGKNKGKQKLKVLVEDDPNANIDDIIGSIKTDNPVNAVDLVNAVRRGD